MDKQEMRFIRRQAISDYLQACYKNHIVPEYSRITYAVRQYEVAVFGYQLQAYK